MRIYVSAINKYGLTTTNAAATALSPSLAPSPSIAPSPSQSQFQFPINPNKVWSLFYFPPVPVIDSAFDLATLCVISAVLLLSLLSLAFIINLRLRSRRSHHLHNFNSQWTVRLLLVLFISLWALNEVLRLPFFRRRYIYPFLPSLTLSNQSDLCKAHVVLSLGLFQPGFLITLLMLINSSVSNQRHTNQLWSVASVFFMCCPTLLLQIFFVFLSPLEAHLPMIMHRNAMLTVDSYGKKTLMCTYPLFSSMVLAAFAVAYSLGLLLSCWRVVSLVINKGTRIRINILAFTVMTALFLQIAFMGLSSLWSPETMAYGGLVLAMFVTVAICAAVGEFILVIKPIVDALAAGGDCCRWEPGVRLRTQSGSARTNRDRSL